MCAIFFFSSYNCLRSRPQHWSPRTTTARNGHDSPVHLTVAIKEESENGLYARAHALIYIIIIII